MMYIKIFILSLFFMTLIILALGIKVLFNKKAHFPGHSCLMEDNGKEECSNCGLKNILDRKYKSNLN